MRYTQLTAPVAILLGLSSAVVHAQAVVSPNGSASTIGGSQANSAPFNNISRYQQIYASTQFSAITSPELITQIAFRPSAGQNSAFSHNFTNIRFDLSTTSTAVGSLGSNFAGNVGANDSIVFNGPLTLSSANVAGSGTAKAFDVIIPLTTPFLYNPAAGNLLLDIRNSDTSASTFAGFVDGVPDGSATPQVRLNFVDNSTSAATGSVQNFGLITQFTFTPTAATPEPGSIALLASSSVLGAGLLARRRKQSRKTV